MVPHEHLTLAKHLSAETKTEEFIAGRGVVTRWERVRKQNHWLDALYNASAAAAHCGVKLVTENPPPRAATKPSTRPQPPRGRDIWGELRWVTGPPMPWRG